MNRWLKNILLLAAVFLSVSYAVFATAKGKSASQHKVCSDINISISDSDTKMLISSEEIANLLKQHELNPIGQSLDKIRTKTIEDRIKQHPMVRDAECYKKPDGTIQIVINQRTPILRVMGDEDYYVDDMCKILPISSTYSAYVPVVTGRVTRKAATSTIYEFAEFLKKNEFWNNQIVQIYINDKLQVELVPRVGSHTIVLGSFDRYEQKLEKLRKFYLYGLNEIGWETYSKIDLQYRDQVVCTR